MRDSSSPASSHHDFQKRFKLQKHPHSTRHTTPDQQDFLLTGDFPD
jgi:hypothetical protein